MSTSVIKRTAFGAVSFSILTDEEIVAAWNTPGQGNAEARARGDMCVQFECRTQEIAIAMSRIFIREFAIPCSCHWDGVMLSCYCGGAGSGYKALMERLCRYGVNQ